MPSDAISDPGLERELLRKGVLDRLAAGRRCTDCRRTPLVGENVYHYDDGRMRCELCKALRREQPVESELVHGAAHGITVRPAIRVAA
jgi:hypothetical protein